MNSPEIASSRGTLHAFVRLTDRVRERNGVLGVYAIRRQLKVGGVGVASLIDNVCGSDKRLQEHITDEHVAIDGVRQRIVDGLRGVRFVGVNITKPTSEVTERTVTLFGDEADMGPWASVSLRCRGEEDYQGIYTTVCSPELTSGINRSWGTQHRLTDAVSLNDDGPVGPGHKFYIPLYAVREVNGVLADIAKTYPAPTNQ